MRAFEIGYRTKDDHVTFNSVIYHAEHVEVADSGDLLGLIDGVACWFFTRGTWKWCVRVRCKCARPPEPKRRAARPRKKG